MQLDLKKPTEKYGPFLMKITLCDGFFLPLIRTKRKSTNCSEHFIFVSSFFSEAVPHFIFFNFFKKPLQIISRLPISTLSEYNFVAQCTQQGFNCLFINKRMTGLSWLSRPQLLNSPSLAVEKTSIQRSGGGGEGGH
jgi:hypothetical protein